MQKQADLYSILGVERNATADQIKKAYRELAMKYQIQSIPTLILFKDGEPVNSLIGLNSKSEIENMINS